jgi:hypothetical protein
MTELRPLIEGIYADDEGNIYIDMRKFLTHHGLPDRPEMREIVRSEIADIFRGLPLFELLE